MATKCQHLALRLSHLLLSSFALLDHFSVVGGVSGGPKTAKSGCQSCARLLPSGGGARLRVATLKGDVCAA
jgi:hypothetical protein